MSDQEESFCDTMKHQCKICDKSFASGQALGGHMRSHSSSKSPSETEKLPQKRIIKRKLPHNDGYFVPFELKKEKEIEGFLVPFELKKEEENEGCLVPFELKKEKEIEGFCTADCKREIGEAAGCLMLLSRDTLFWAAAKNGCFDLGFKNLGKLSSKGDDGLGFSAVKKLKVQPLDKNFEKVDHFGGKVKKGAKVKSFKKGKNYEKSKVPSLNEYGQYECATCHRTFSSFQALGGHVASHRKSQKNSEIEASIAQFVINTSQDEIGFIDLDLRI